MHIKTNKKEEEEDMPAGYAEVFDFPNLTQDVLQKRVDGLLKKAQGFVDEILAVEGERTVENTLDKLEEVYLTLSTVAAVHLIEETYPDSDIQDTARECSEKISNFSTSLALNVDLYKAIEAVDISNADAETKRFWDNEVRDFKRHGADKDEETRARIQELFGKGEKVGNDFNANIRRAQGSIEVTPEELDGLPESYIKSHPPNEDGKVVITTDYPDLVPFMSFAKSADARRRLYMENINKAYPENDSVLRELVSIRQEIARLLGYKNYVDYDTETKMTKSASAVKSFLKKLEKLTRTPAKRDAQLLLELKKKDDPDAKALDAWDGSYYAELYNRQEFDLNAQDLMPYFEYESVKQGILNLTSKLFGVSYRQVDDVPVWHESVECYEVTDNESKELLGRFYLDMHPRKNKYNHAACFDLAVGVKGRQLPEAVLVCNFPDPSKQKNALMQYNDVNTFLHEFGHLLHGIFGGHVGRVALSGISTEWDFVEAPSQMLEHFLESVETLQTFAQHYETKEPIPAELVEKTLEADKFGRGLFVRRQIFLADLSFSIYYKDADSYSFEDLHRELHKKYGFSNYPEGGHFWCAFGHLNGYSCIYYTYMWSKVIALDLFSGFDTANLLDTGTAKKYRRSVLEPGGTKDAADLLEDFLGRPYGYDSFKRWLEE